MKKIDKNKNKLGEPDYQMSGNKIMEKIVNDLSKRGTEILLNRNGSDGQTDMLANNLIRKTIGHIDIENLSKHLPKLSDVEIAARATKIILEPLKKIDEKNIFGGVWNEKMAIAATQRLGLPESNLRTIISGRGPTSQKLRLAQAETSRECEDLLKRKLEKEPPEMIKIVIQLETWFKSLIDELRVDLEKTTLSKEQKGQTIEDSIWAFLQILNFSPKQDVSSPKLLKTLLDGHLGKTVNVVDLHCLTFKNSESDGVTVCDNAEEIGDRVSHSKRLSKILEFVKILEDASISHSLNIIVIDNDRFVMPGQEEKINSFVISLNKVTSKLGLNLEAIKASDLVNPNDSLPEWETRNKLGSKTTEKMVNDAFETIQNKPLPTSFKTRTFARELAKRSFTVQFALGKNIPILFEPSISLINARASQQATEIFRLGGKELDPLIFTFWI